jgi:hypothetical protein
LGAPTYHSGLFLHLHINLSVQELLSDAVVFQKTHNGLAETGNGKAARRANSMLDSVSRMQHEDGGATVARLKRVIQVTIQWQELTYTVPVGRGKKRSTKTVLDAMSGHVEPGRLLAVMGPTGLLPAAMAVERRLPASPPAFCAEQLTRHGPLHAGSGKTSLINALAGRLPRGGSLHGEVLVNGTPRGRGFRSITAYVLQVQGGQGVLGCLLV